MKNTEKIEEGVRPSWTDCFPLPTDVLSPSRPHSAPQQLPQARGLQSWSPFSFSMRSQQQATISCNRCARGARSTWLSHRDPERGQDFSNVAAHKALELALQACIEQMPGKLVKHVLIRRRIGAHHLARNCHERRPCQHRHTDHAVRCQLSLALHLARGRAGVQV